MERVTFTYTVHVCTGYVSSQNRRNPQGVAKSKSPGCGGCWHCGPMNLGRRTDEGVRPYIKSNSISGGDTAVFLQPLLSPWYSVSRNECISGES